MLNLTNLLNDIVAADVLPIDYAIARRSRVAWRHLLQTGATPPIRRVRVRWLREARDRRKEREPRDQRGEQPDVVIATPPGQAKP